MRFSWHTLAIIVLLIIVLFSGIKIVATVTEQKRLNGLIPSVRAKVETLRNILASKGIKTLVGSTLRTTSEQASAVASGNSSTSNSWHLLGRAIDLYPYRAGQSWDKGDAIDYKVMHDEAVKLGGQGLAFNPDGSKRFINTSKGKIWDGGHIEFRDGMTFEQAKTRHFVT